MFGEEMGYYVLATTVETNEKGPTRPGAINGGFYPKKPDWPAQYPSIVISVNDIKKAAGKVEKAGGTVLGEPMEIPGVGRYVSFVDPEGNRVSMLQPVPHNWHAPKAKAKKKTGTKKAVVSRSTRARKAVRRSAGKRS
jgi:predicted enzyme related to lactoylglutathione lyase